MSIRSLLAAAGLLLVVTAAPIAAAKTPKPVKAAPPAKSLIEGLQLFQVDAAHSSIEFTVAWMGISKVRGTFTDISGTLALDRGDLARSSATFVMKIASLTTFNERRDRDLKTADWFDAAKFPTAVFSSQAVEKQGDGFVMHGTLTLHGVTKDIEIPFTSTGSLKDPGGVERVAYEGRTTLARKDYGIVGPARYNAILEIGKAMVGDDVEMPLTILAFRAPPRDTLQDRAADSLWRAIMARGVAPVVKEYRALRAVTPDSLMPVNEPRLSTVGYQLVERGKPADALEVFRVQAEAYPQSASSLTGMAYACATLGDRENTIANADKAVALNPSATRALEILRRARTATAN